MTRVEIDLHRRNELLVHTRPSRRTSAPRWGFGVSCAVRVLGRCPGLSQVGPLGHKALDVERGNRGEQKFNAERLPLGGRW